MTINVTLPKSGDPCGKCSRPMDASVASKFWPWSCPVIDGKTGKAVCSMCYEMERGFSPNIPASSLRNLAMYAMVTV